MINFYKNSTVLITGGTGSFGNAYVADLLKRFDLKKIIIFSRDEMKQWHMAKAFNNHKKLRFFIGDVRDKSRLDRALDDVDYVVHAAATKIVPTAEYNPFECVKTNINGAMNLIDACLDKKIKKVVALSTDKASSPINLYGATKLTSDKLFIAANSYSGSFNTQFSVVRYGNVMGSRGSVIPYFLTIKKNEPYPITHMDMTRFMITLNQGIDLVHKAFTDSQGGEIYVKKIPSIYVKDIIAAINPKAKIDIIGIRPGEKLHEQMIGEEDSEFTYEYNDFYKIIPAIFSWKFDQKKLKGGIKVNDNFFYRSDKNTDWMSTKFLSKWIKQNLKFLEI